MTFNRTHVRPKDPLLLAVIEEEVIDDVEARLDGRKAHRSS